MADEKLAYTIPEAVAASGMSRSSLYEAIKAGALLARKNGARTFILAVDLRAWLEGLPHLDTRSAT